MEEISVININSSNRGQEASSILFRSKEAIVEYENNCTSPQQNVNFQIL